MKTVSEMFSWVNNNKEVVRQDIKKLKQEKEKLQKELDSFDVSLYVEASEYRDYLNDLYGTVMVCGKELSAGTLLQDHDSVAFNTGMSEWLDDYPKESIAKYQEILDSIEQIENDISDLEDEEEDCD